MLYPDLITDRQVGRNADLFARSIGEMKDPAERYPYLRILISIIEQAHPEWNNAPGKAKQIAHLIGEMSKNTVDQSEVEEIVTLRDEERSAK
ncbi:MAG: DUF4290 domain-containing protein [Rhodothermales bacterium]|nr:DUF4290 domain-containing protein [Rhodothermales bacterium]